MRVSETMTRDVRLATTDQTIQEAASAMAGIDAGALPVSDGGRLVGMITDRDIVIRAVAAGKGPQTKVSEVMTADLICCFDDQEVEEVAQNMADTQLRRLPVVNHDRELVGILSLGDITIVAAEKAGEALSGISRPGTRAHMG